MKILVARECDREAVLALFIEYAPVRAARLVQQRAQADLLIAKFLGESLAIGVDPDCVEIEGCEAACSAGIARIRQSEHVVPLVIQARDTAVDASDQVVTRSRSGMRSAHEQPARLGQLGWP